MTNGKLTNLQLYLTKANAEAKEMTSPDFNKWQDTFLAFIFFPTSGLLGLVLFVFVIPATLFKLLAFRCTFIEATSDLITPIKQIIGGIISPLFDPFNYKKAISYPRIADKFITELSDLINLFRNINPKNFSLEEQQNLKYLLIQAEDVVKLYTEVISLNEKFVTSPEFDSIMKAVSKDMSIYKEAFKQLVTKLNCEIDFISNKQASNNQAPPITELAPTSPPSQLSSPQLNTSTLGSEDLKFS